MLSRQSSLGLIALVLTGWYIMSKFKHFKMSEFADKLSGKNKMNRSTILKLDKARELAGIPFIVNSGYRDENHPLTKKNPTSSHNKGYAVDIAVNDSNRDIIQKALREAGFSRIGLYNSWIHADDDPSKTQYVTWFDNNRPTIYNQSQVVHYA